jgi:hypothetical protein
MRSFLRKESDNLAPMLLENKTWEEIFQKRLELYSGYYNKYLLNHLNLLKK